MTQHHHSLSQGEVAFVGAGPGDPELLTLRALRLLTTAEVVLHDHLVPDDILALAPQARMVAVGKAGFGPSMKQDDINALIIDHAREGYRVVRLKSGDPGVFGRLDEETTALDAAGIAFHVTPGLTAASAAAASLGVSLTRRGRNSDLRLLTGHDVKGFAEQDWRALARPGAVAAIYMGKRAARFLQGRLMMHGADPQTPVTVVANAARPTERRLPATLSSLAADLDASHIDGPAVLLLGLAPRDAQTIRANRQEAL
ncbi:uroporphyrinogen-III C-methyltransferase [Salipiger aestuarii]|uniref:uroporphyrinogen-III C-methyltransferase n=1 Tax=Salipiger aestuarii TaxID=568098 RepID=UPI00025B695C|nr:uroporphyrinogen-III C-methyltransferase [Salipiger aestuarii]EIE52657.1 uroporphyrin-III C-methyltransferase [Citreicella sp. 357]KAA8610876.1 uroporphyrin-III methyltransferase [Salipiger aestuarii]